jgi:hypothetical protein
MTRFLQDCFARLSVTQRPLSKKSIVTRFSQSTPFQTNSPENKESRICPKFLESRIC